MTDATIAFSGARESHAGHEFHFLWAARRIVQLLDPSSKLQRVKIEGVAPSDDAAKGGAEFLAVDITEYFGGDDFATAQSTVISQLKYSTRNPDHKWTIGRLCRKEKGGRTLLGSLAEAYAGFRRQAPECPLAGRLRIQLVSNQSLATKAVALWEHVQGKLAGRPSISLSLLRRSLNAMLRVDLDRCLAVIKLPVSIQADFFRCLDFSRCGVAALELQQLALAADVTASFPGRPREASDRLLSLIRKAALPAAASEAGIGIHELLANFSVSSYDRLFPCRSLLEKPVQPVDTDDARQLAQAVVATATNPLLVHGGAGTGKSTTLNSLPDFLPPGSVVVYYDCFGRGEYLDFSRARHIESRVWLQLSNELAVRCNSPFLIEPPHERHDLRLAFEGRLTAAAAIVRASGGLLVIAIDAADNAVHAGRLGIEPAFVSALWSLRVPEGARLIVSTRSERREMLGAPQALKEFRLSGFDKGASAAYLRQHYPSADDAACLAFHCKTDGNPRVQKYLLSSARTLANVLRLAARTPEGIFQELLDDATRHWTHPSRARSHLAVLVSLARPAPLTVFAAACAVPLTEVESFCEALKPGLLIEGNSVAFRDEPFETFLREQFTAEARRETDTQLATYFLGLALNDAYAARAVAEHLHRSSDGIRLIRLALEGPEPTVVSDEAERLAVIWRRVALALHWTRGVELPKLLLVAADTARAHGALTNLVKARPDLAALHANREQLERLYLNDSEHTWLGPAFWRLGAVYSRHPELRTPAKEAMQHAEGWLQRWKKGGEQERKHWHFEAEDVSNAGIAIYSLNGPKAAVEWWLRWRPRQFREDILQQLVPAVARRLRREDWSEIATLRLPLRIWAILLVVADKAGNSPPAALIRTVIVGLLRLARSGRRLPRITVPYITELCELSARLGVGRRQIVIVLNRYGPKIPQYVPSIPLDISSWENPLRSALLRGALLGREVKLPELLSWAIKKPQDQIKLDSERRTLVEKVGDLFDAHQLRINALLSRLDWKAAKAHWLDELKEWEGKVSHRWFKAEWRYIRWAEIVCDILLLGRRDFTQLLERIADLASKAVPGSGADFWTTLSAKLLRQTRYSTLGWRLLEQAVDDALSRAIPGKQRWETLLNCAAIASDHDATRGRDYYERAMEAAIATQDGAVRQLAFHTRLAETIASEISVRERDALAVRLGSTVESHESLVSEPETLPWASTLGAMTTLDLATGLAWAGRWDDEGQCDLDGSIAAVAIAAVKSGHVTPFAGLALLRFLRDHQDPGEHFQELLEAQHAVGAIGRRSLVEMLAAMSLWIRRDVLPQRRDAAAQAVLAWADGHGHKNAAGLEELRQLRKFIHSLPEQSSGIIRAAYNSSSEPKPTRKQRRGSIRSRLSSAWAANEETEIGACLKVAAANTPESARRAFLDFLFGLEFRPLYVTGRIRAVTEFLSTWRRSASVQRWGRESLPAFLERIMPALLHYDYGSEEVRVGLIELIEAVGAPLEDTLRTALESHVRLLTSPQALALAEILLARLPCNKQHETLNWSLQRTETRLAAESLPARPSVNTPYAKVNAKALAGFLWAQSGHPDRPTRWRALHAAREIGCRDVNVLSGLVTCASRKDDAGNRSPRLEFFWMSARCAMLLLFRRLAASNPLLLREHAKAIAAFAIDSDHPHVIVRELARNAAVALAELFPRVLSAVEREQLVWVNRPYACHYQRGASQELAVGPAPIQQARRYRFDPIDTIPYWFTPAARVFGLTAEQFEQRAEVWICDRWGQTEADWWSDPRELKRRGHWSRSSHRQGQIPEYEIHRLYLEFHAMCCVAGELVDSMPVIYDTYEDAPCPFVRWLRYELSQSDEEPYWLADLRQPTPLQPKYWGVFPELKSWRTNRPIEEYDAALRGGNGAEWIVVNGDTSVKCYDRTEVVSVDSYLVTPNSGLALLRAMQTAESPFDFALPFSENENQLEEPGFELRAFIQPVSGEVRMQQYDPLRRDVSPGRMCFGHDFAVRLGASLDDASQRITDTGKNDLARLEQWSDLQGEGEDANKPASTGRRVLVRERALRKYLALRGLDLITTVKLSRNAEWHYRDDNDEYDLGTIQVYLFRADGRRETLARSRPTRSTSRKRTRS